MDAALAETDLILVTCALYISLPNSTSRTSKAFRRDEDIDVFSNLSMFSFEEMLASIDPVKKRNMSTFKRYAAQGALERKLCSARGRIRSEFQGISYSDCKNLFAYVSKFIKIPYLGFFWTLSPYWVEVVDEVQSIVQEYECSPKATTSKQNNCDLVHSQVPESNGISIGDDRIPFPVPIPIPTAAQIGHGSYHNSGEQHLRGLINNQTGYVSGNGNGSYFVNIMTDCKFSLNKGHQMAD